MKRGSIIFSICSRTWVPADSIACTGIARKAKGISMLTWISQNKAIIFRSGQCKHIFQWWCCWIKLPLPQWQYPMWVSARVSCLDRHHKKPGSPYKLHSDTKSMSKQSWKKHEPKTQHDEWLLFQQNKLEIMESSNTIRMQSKAKKQKHHSVISWFPIFGALITGIGQESHSPIFRLGKWQHQTN